VVWADTATNTQAAQSPARWLLYDELSMFKIITSGLFILLLSVEIIERQTDYTVSSNFLNFISKAYLTIFIIGMVVMYFNKLPRQLVIGVTIVVAISLIILGVLTFPALIMSTSGHSVATKKWSGNSFRIENVRGQDWAGPNYDNYILYKTKFAGFFKKQLCLTPLALLTDTCIIKFVEYDYHDSTIYYFDDCQKELKVERK